MSLSSENILLLGSILLFVSILASKTSYKVGVPALIFFLIVGMLAGSEGPGGIYFDNPLIAKFLGVVALTFILFSGGLDTKWQTIRPVLKRGIALSTLGVLITTALVGLFASYLLKVSILQGLLLGAIVSSTDAAAVFSVLRSRKVGLKGNLRPLLELESGSNDPMAFFLTISFIQLIAHPETSAWLMIPRFLQGMVLGTLCGYAFGRIMTFVLNKINLDIDGLYPVLTLSLVFFTFSFTDFVGGNGFLAIYISAVVLGNSSFIHKKSLIRFYDGQAWLMQIIMFLTLGLLVFPSQMIPTMGQGVLLSLFLIFAARPIATFLSLAFSSDLNIRKKLFISWVGLRGAAPIVFATYPLLAGIPYANTIFNLVFFISVSSVLIQGTTLPYAARLLHLTVPEKVKRKFPIDLELSDDHGTELFEVNVPSDSPAVGKPIVQLGLPGSALIVLIHRDGRYLTPKGETPVQDNDHLLIVVDKPGAIDEVNRVLGTKAEF